MNSAPGPRPCAAGLVDTVCGVGGDCGQAGELQAGEPGLIPTRVETPEQRFPKSCSTEPRFHGT